MNFALYFCALICAVKCAPLPSHGGYCPSVIELKAKQMESLGFAPGSYKLGKLDVQAAPSSPSGFIMTCQCSPSSFKLCEFSLGSDLFKSSARQVFQVIEKPGSGMVMKSPVFTCGSDSKYSVTPGQSGPSVKKNSGGRVDQVACVSHDRE